MRKRIKKFLKYFAVILSLIILIVGIFALVAYRMLMKNTNIPENAVLEIYLPESPPDFSTEKSPIETMVLGESPVITLKKCIDLINQAADDDKIKAIAINGKSQIRQSSILEIGEAIDNFKSTGKSVYAYGDYYTQSGYMLSAQADSIFINPTGQIDLTGYIIVLTYFKEFLDKFDIDMEVFVAGKYKSYVEMYQRTNSSERNRNQYLRYINYLQDELVQHISDHRNIIKQSIRDIIQKNKSGFSKNALELGLIDSIIYKTDYENLLKNRFHSGEDYLVSLNKYNQYKEFRAKKAGKANVAYVAIEGAITDNGSIASTNNLRKSFKKIRDSENIKTVILRVNSPGGSATASEEIWHEIELIKEQGIKVISSVSSVAGSGGYYVMCNSDKIFANKNSITGSIGAFTAFPIYGQALDNNLGITFDEFTTGPFSNRNMGFKPLNSEQREYFQNQIDVLYKHFKSRVAEGRNISTKQIDSIAQGKIYVAEDALAINLVDSLISLQGVYEYVKKDLGEEIVLEEYPKVKSELFSAPEFVISIIDKEYGLSTISKNINSHIEEFKAMIKTPQPMTRMEFLNVY